MASKPASAAENGFEYPELSVVPRASERLDLEAAREKEQGWQVHLPYLVPASMTFLTGVVLQAGGTKYDTDPMNTGARYAPWVGIGIGAAWWAVSVGILNHLDVYSEGTAEVSKLPKGSQREQLLRERRAEEAIFRAGALARRLKWISVATNLGASMYMASSAKEKEFPVYFAIASAVTAFTPILFPHRWETTESLQREYKKRIYAPVVGATMLQDPNGKVFSPGLQVAFQF